MSKILKLPVYHLDSFYWKPGWLPTADEEWIPIAKDLASRDEWIIDGGYSSTLDDRLGLKGNHYGHEKPYHWVSFYESGSEYIGLIESYNKQAIDNKKLFFLMNQGQLMGIEYGSI